MGRQIQQCHKSCILLWEQVEDISPLSVSWPLTNYSTDEASKDTKLSSLPLLLIRRRKNSIVGIKLYRPSTLGKYSSFIGEKEVWSGGERLDY